MIPLTHPLQVKSVAAHAELAGKKHENRAAKEHDELRDPSLHTGFT